MTAWRVFLNDRLPDCGVAACCNAILLWGGSVNDTDAQIADDRFSSNDYNAKVLWGWWRRGIGNNKLGGFATIKSWQIEEAVSRFGCAFVVFDKFEGVGPHAVLAIKGDKVVSWGREYGPAVIDPSSVTATFVIAPRFSPILIWYAITNNPRWLFLLSPLWWPQ